MTLPRRSRLNIGSRGNPSACAALVLTLGFGSLVVACQKQEDHPPFAAGCEGVCAPLPGISVGVGSGSAGSSSAASDAGPASLTGQVLVLKDDSFVTATPYPNGATISADGASGSPVTATWDGATPYQLDGVARLATNWVSVKPTLVGGDALLTYRAVQTTTTSSIDLAMASQTVLSGIFTAVSSLQSPNFGQVVLFFRSAGGGAALSGLHVVMPKAELAAYKSAAGWILDDGTAITDTSGLVVFGNVDPANSAGTQAVTVTKAATSTSAAVSEGQFAVRVVQGAVTIATVGIQL